MFNMLILFGALLILNFKYANCDVINIDIIPTSDSHCPGEFIGEPCLTLQEYATRSNCDPYFFINGPNQTLVLQPGNHFLFSELYSETSYLFTMRATRSNAVSITCSQTTSYSGPQFSLYTTQLIISDITFIGCQFYLLMGGYAPAIVKLTLIRNSFVNSRNTGSCIDLYNYNSNSSVLIKQCNFSGLYSRAINYSGPGYRNYGYGNYGYGNYGYGNYGYGNYGYGYRYESNFTIDQCTFEDNSYATGALVYYSVEYGMQSTYVSIINSHFNGNRVGHSNSQGTTISGVIYILDYSYPTIIITNTTFINNTVIGGEALCWYGLNTNISLTNNIFSHNTASSCGVLSLVNSHLNSSGNIFTYNRAVGQVDAGGVICAKYSSISLLDDNFSHNSAAGNGGVMKLESSEVTVDRSIFSNNRAGGNGGVFHAYFHPTTYTISRTSFTNNHAGDDGGVLFVGRSGSQVRISQSTFNFNSATNRGGAIAIFGSTLEINGASFFDAVAEKGGVISACTSNVTIINPLILPTQDTAYSFCDLYDSLNITITKTTAETTPITVPGPTTNALTTLTEGDITLTSTDPSLEMSTAHDGISSTTTPPSTTMQEEETTIEQSAIEVTTTQTTVQDRTMKVTTSYTESSDSIGDFPITCSGRVNGANEKAQDLAPHNIPGYIAIGAVAVLLVLFVVFGAVVIIKAIQVKMAGPQSQKRLPIKEDQYPTKKNEYTLEEVHVVST